jgi:hypothetical protein
MSDGPTQTHVSVTRACGKEPVKTLGEPLITGPPTCGTMPVTMGLLGETMDQKLSFAEINRSVS